MKKGFWNYIEPIIYRVVMVEILPVEVPKIHWQNAFAATKRQAVEIEGADTSVRFFIDNGDGTGLLKIRGNGGPEYSSRHLFAGAFIVVDELKESDWINYTASLFKETEATIMQWSKKTHPVEWARVEALKADWKKSKFNTKRATRR